MTKVPKGHIIAADSASSIRLMAALKRVPRAELKPQKDRPSEFAEARSNASTIPLRSSTQKPGPEGGRKS